VSVDRPPDLRGWCAILASLTAAFAAYISLVPFNFTWPPDATLADAFHRLLETGLVSRSNFAGNVLLFCPFGFFGAGSVFSAPRRAAAQVIGAAVLVTLSVALSFAIEFVQVFVPGRTPSLADVTAQTAGMSIGLAGWLLVARDIHRWAGRRRSDRKHGALHLALLVFAAGRVVTMLLPLDVTLDLGLLAEKYRNGLIVLNPIGSPNLTWNALPATVADLLLSLPIGALACLWGMPQGHQRRAGPALLLGWAIVAFVEAAQVFVLSRTADAGDWLVNAIGVAGGVWLTRRVMPGQSGPAPAAASWIPIGGLAMSLAFYAFYNWSPFDFQLSGEFIRPRVPMILQAPFYGYYQNPEIKAVTDLLVKIALGVPIGLTLGWSIGVSGPPYRRAVFAIASVMTALFVAVVEAGQILLPTRYPDSTDILLGLTGVLLGSWVVRRFSLGHRL
jgi:VanZ family protein